MGKVRFGLENVHYAIWNASESTYGDWKPFKGAVSLSADTDSKQTDFYADNVVYATIDSASKETGSIEIAALTKEIETDLLGYVADTTSGLNYQSTDTQEITVALGYEISGNEEKQRGVRYNVKFSRPSQSAKTKQDTTDPDTVTLNYTAIGRDFTIGGKTVNVLKAHCDNSGTDHKAYDNFFKKVPVPGVATPSV